MHTHHPPLIPACMHIILFLCSCFISRFLVCPRTVEAIKSELAPVGASAEEIDKYVASIKMAVDTKYKLLQKAFLAADKDRSNCISEAELMQVCKNFALPIPAEHIKDIMDHMDHNSDGKVSYKEFCKVMHDYELEH